MIGQLRTDIQNRLDELLVEAENLRKAHRGSALPGDRCRHDDVSGNKNAARLEAWARARKHYRLSHAHVQMARELGLNPKKLGSLANHRQEPWKAPLPDFIEHLYLKRFGRARPGAVSRGRGAGHDDQPGPKRQRIGVRQVDRVGHCLPLLALSDSGPGWQDWPMKLHVRFEAMCCRLRLMLTPAVLAVACVCVGGCSSSQPGPGAWIPGGIAAIRITDATGLSPVAVRVNVTAPGKVRQIIGWIDHMKPVPAGGVHNCPEILPSQPTVSLAFRASAGSPVLARASESDDGSGATPCNAFWVSVPVHARADHHPATAEADRSYWGACSWSGSNDCSRSISVSATATSSGCFRRLVGDPSRLS